MHDATETRVGPPSSDINLYKALVGLVTGGVGEGVDRLTALASELDSAVDDPASVETVPMSVNGTLMILVGWISELPEQLDTARSTASNAVSPLNRVAGVAYDTGAALAEATGLAPLISEITAPTRQAVAEELDRLSKVGTAEYARGRVLVVQAVERSVDGVVGYLGESEELGELVREQTLGVTGSAVREMRETGAAADALAEGVFRKLFGRSDRPLPPMPAVDPR